MSIFWLLCLVCSHIGLTTCISSKTNDIFEFGVDKGRVSFNVVGNIGLFEKNTKIPIEVPYCMKLTYVRVEVDNSLGPPVVSLDHGLQMVTIKYRPLQHSKSTYSVTAKTLPMKKCDLVDDSNGY
ncbi:uncharacterized protein LOC114353879 [Ostrinia furnacalis]|uniref:uncharacterized protein LOC114353879 n=1 Tax=Ostrinia furnacalis TaxID=93504 RepID=UPI00103F28AA|nr:uncharacterized protein LOC114353879 [Ostrinia furnacalis]